MPSRVDAGDMSLISGEFDSRWRRSPAGEARAARARRRSLSAHAATHEDIGGAGDGTGGGTNYSERHGKHEVVLSVHVPGRDPYADYLEKFDHKKGKAGFR